MVGDKLAKARFYPPYESIFLCSGIRRREKFSFLNEPFWR